MNYNGFNAMDYLYLGRIVALTLLQGGHGLPVFSEATARYILTSKFMDLRPEDFPEEEREQITTVQLLGLLLFHNNNTIKYVTVQS